MIISPSTLAGRSYAPGSAFNLGMQPEDCWLCCLPLSHIAGLSIVMRSVIYGSAVGLHESFEVDRVAATLEKGEYSVVSLVPTMLVRLLEAGVDLSTPRAILVGGGPVPDDALEEAVTAVVVLRGDADLPTEELRRHCASELAGYKVPKRIEIASALPRTPSGKLLRRALR